MEKTTTFSDISHRLAFRKLATYFLDSANPPLYNYVSVLNCILDYDGPLPAVRLRHFAHSFFRTAESAIERALPRRDTDTEEYIDWIYNWLQHDKE